MSEMVERVARIIDPSSWRVMDSEKASMLRKYKGKNVGWPSDQFQHKESMAKAQEIIAAMQADTDLERIKRERDQAVEALKTTNAWLDRWARHIGDCPGIDDCTCGLTRVRYEAETTLASIEGSGHE